MANHYAKLFWIAVLAAQLGLVVAPMRGQQVALTDDELFRAIPLEDRPTGWLIAVHVRCVSLSYHSRSSGPAVRRSRGRETDLGGAGPHPLGGIRSGHGTGQVRMQCVVQVTQRCRLTGADGSEASDAEQDDREGHGGQPRQQAAERDDP